MSSILFDVFESSFCYNANALGAAHVTGTGRPPFSVHLRVVGLRHGGSFDLVTVDTRDFARLDEADEQSTETQK